MASTVPAKSQPLHNFTLPHLKWNKDGHSSGNHHRRRSTKSPSRRPNPPSAASPVRHSPLRDSVGATPPRYQSPLRDAAAAAATSSPRASPVHGNYLGKQSATVGESSKPEGFREGAKYSQSPARGGDIARHLLPSRDLVSESEDLVRIKGGFIEHRRNSSKNSVLDSARSGVYTTNSERDAQKFETRSRTKDVDVAGIKRSKILIKIPCKSNKAEEDNPQDEPPKIDEDGEGDEAHEEGKINNFDEESKTWNLRPRKPIRKSLNMNGVTVKINGSSVPEKHKTQSPSRNLHKTEGKCYGGGGGEKKEKRKLSVSVALLKEEIEEDIFALTGSKPARRPKKRAKNIQKQVDCVFPGLWLVGITADSYKVSENSLKG